MHGTADLIDGCKNRGVLFPPSPLEQTPPAAAPVINGWLWEAVCFCLVDGGFLPARFAEGKPSACVEVLALIETTRDLIERWPTRPRLEDQAVGVPRGVAGCVASTSLRTEIERWSQDRRPRCLGCRRCGTLWSIRGGIPRCSRPVGSDINRAGSVWLPFRLPPAARPVCTPRLRPHVTFPHQLSATEPTQLVGDRGRWRPGNVTAESARDAGEGG